MELAFEEWLVLSDDNAAVDIAKTDGFAVEPVVTAVVALAKLDGDNIAGDVIDVKSVVASGVLFKAMLLMELSEVALCEAEPEALAHLPLEETRAMTMLEFWTESAEAEATIHGINEIYI